MFEPVPCDLGSNQFSCVVKTDFNHAEVKNSGKILFLSMNKMLTFLLGKCFLTSIEEILLIMRCKIWPIFLHMFCPRRF